MKKTCALVGILLMLAAYAPAANTVPDLVRGNTAFALDLYAQLGESGKNLFFSPFSISTALAMTYAGARESTAAEMADALHFPPDHTKLHPLFSELLAHLGRIGEKGEIKLHSANAIWIEKTYAIQDSFQTLNRSRYGAAIFSTDFIKEYEASRKKINLWVEERTESKIRDLLPPGIIDDRTRMVLTNAVYFFGKWAAPFPPRSTQEADFFVSPSHSVRIPMMQQKAHFGYAESDLCQVLELPYRGKDLSMLILLPRERDGLPGLESGLTAESLLRLTSDLKRKEVRIHIPKFQLTESFDLKQALRDLGMIRAFTRRADFSGMEPKRELFVSAVIHKAFLAVDEAGTEAAAATAVIMALKASMPLGEPPVFRADHPFLFLIRDNATASVLFLGRLIDPSRSDPD